MARRKKRRRSPALDVAAKRRESAPDARLEVRDARPKPTELSPANAHQALDLAELSRAARELRRSAEALHDAQRSMRHVGVVEDG